MNKRSEFDPTNPKGFIGKIWNQLDPDGTGFSSKVWNELNPNGKGFVYDVWNQLNPEGTGFVASVLDEFDASNPTGLVGRLWSEVRIYELFIFLETF